MTDKARGALADALAELGWHQDAQAIREEMDSPRVDAAIEVINAALRTAPAIDLEQFRQAVACWRRVLPPDSKGREKAERLLALIDSQGTAIAVPDGWVMVPKVAGEKLLNALYDLATSNDQWSDKDLQGEWDYLLAASQK